MEKILITGATGFIGKFLVQYLHQQNFHIRILVRDPNQAIVFPKIVEIFNGDLTDAQSLKGACSDIDTVFHLGGYAHAWTENNPAFTNLHETINFKGTQHILNEAIQSGVKRFVYFSSVKAVADSQECINESFDAFPSSPYGIAKRKAETLVLAAKAKTLHVSVIRPALVYGPEWKGNLKTMLRAIDRGFFLPLPETHNRRSMVSVDDICHAAILAATHPLANGQLYFVTDGKSYSTRELYVLMCRALGKRVPKWHIPFSIFKFLGWVGDLGNKLIGHRLPVNSDVISKLFDSAHYSSHLIQRELGFKSVYDFETMLPEIITAYRNHTK